MHSHTWDRDLFGQILGQVCDQANLSQADLARLSGKSQSTVSRWTNSRNQPNYDAIKRLVARLQEGHPELGDLPRMLMAAAGYEVLPPPEDAPRSSAPQNVRHAVQVLREEAEISNRPLVSVLIEDGLVAPDELIVPDTLPPDPTIEEINASDISGETKANLIRLHLENRARRFEEERLKRTKPDDRN